MASKSNPIARERRADSCMDLPPAAMLDLRIITTERRRGGFYGSFAYRLWLASEPESDSPAAVPSKSRRTTAKEMIAAQDKFIDAVGFERVTVQPNGVGGIEGGSFRSRPITPLQGMAGTTGLEPTASA